MRINQPTGYNLVDEVSNGSTDELPLPYQVLRSVHQLYGELLNKRAAITIEWLTLSKQVDWIALKTPNVNRPR